MGLCALAMVEADSSRAAQPPPLTTRKGAVAADDAKASEVGAAILARGGSAADAAVATALALGVVNPTSSGIGGGGFAVVHDAASGKTTVYDFRETAPAALDPGDFVRDGKLDPTLSRRGGLAVGVPGEVAGLALLHDRHGRLSWRRVVTPAARLARDGFEAGWFLTERGRLALKDLPEEPAYTPLRAFLEPIERGDTVVRDALADTLLAIAERGADAFYRGPVADGLVATVQGAGGVLTAEDLASYEVVEREPLWGTWRGMKLATMPLPSSGGFVLLEMLGIVDALEARGIDLAALGVGSSAALHVIGEVLTHGFADRARLLGDTDDARAIAERLLDPASLAEIAARIELDKKGAHDRYGHVELARGTGTSHLCVIDGDGNAIALTTTVNGYFGAKLISPEGVVLNNEIDDFSLEAGVPNMYGLVQSDYNLVAPGKRPLSSMTPVLVFDDQGKVIGCAGGSGGPRIISNVFQVLLGIYELGLDARAAVGMPRVHHQWVPEVLWIDPDLPADVVRGLEARGHEVEPQTSPTAVQAIRRRPDGALEAASDPRKNGAPAAAP